MSSGCGGLLPVDTLLGSAGGPGTLLLALGFLLLILGILAARRRVSLRAAFAIFAAAWTPVPAASLAGWLDQGTYIDEFLKLGPALTSRDVAWAGRAEASVAANGAVALALSLSGAAAAFARSRPARPFQARNP